MYHFVFVYNNISSLNILFVSRIFGGSVKYCYFVCYIPSSRFGVEPGPTAHDRVFVVQRCNSTEFFFIGLCRTCAKLPQTCLCCRRLLVGSDVHCIAIGIVTLTLVFCSLESLLQF